METAGLFKAVRLGDPAMDHAKTGIDKYGRMRDFALVVALPGATLEVFYLRGLSTQVMQRWVKSAPDVATRQERAFRAAVVRVDALRVTDALGKVTETRAVFEPAGVADLARASRGGDVFDVWNDDEYQLVDPATVEEIGEVAFELGNFRRSTSREFKPPPSSVRMLVSEISHRAEQALASRAGGSSESGQQ